MNIDQIIKNGKEDKSGKTKKYYTYNDLLERNHCKRDACIEKGHNFEFHIWDTKEITRSEA